MYIGRRARLNIAVITFVVILYYLFYFGHTAPIDAWYFVPTIIVLLGIMVTSALLAVSTFI